MNYKTKRYQAGGTIAADPMAGKELSSSSTLSSWAAPFVTDVMGRAQSIADKPYEAFTGPLTAGTSDLQSQAFSGLAGLSIPTNDQMTYNPGTFTADMASQYMNPFLMASLNPQLDEARRQAEISRVTQAGRLNRAGAYGGGRQAIMESELNRNLLRNLGDITGKGYATAYEQGRSQFNTEQDQAMQAARQAQLFGLEGLKEQLSAGATQRDIEQQGITADIGQFREERDYPQAMTKFMRDIIGQGSLPISTTNRQFQEESGLSELMRTAGGGLTLYKLLDDIFGKPKP
jgi:hypothetical protein